MKIRQALKDAWNAVVLGKQPVPAHPQKKDALLQVPVPLQPKTVVPRKNLLNIPVPVDQIPKVLDEHIAVMSKFILKQVRGAILNNETDAQLFYVNGTALIARVNESDYENNLKDLMEYFIKSEQYECARECDRLLKKLIVDKLIDETKQRI